ncbi:MAG: ABC transporter ATP-binding protein [Deltaproteobacteria bacterium]|nr:ABC transporter ATP-binding protein [Deltaproteobacteria bacterium]
MARLGREAMGGWIIRTEGLSLRYRGANEDAVHDLDITIEGGTIQGILGPNGAGKTTTLAMLCGLLKPTRGRVRFSDEIDAGSVRRSIGFVPQDLALYPGLTGRENLAFFGRLYGVVGERVVKRIDALLEMVGLEERADDVVRHYSTGMKRRLNLAAGLVHEPSIILLDEPTVGIDPQSRNRILDAVLELRRNGVSILYTTHDMEEASRLCDAIVIIDRGRVLLEGDPGVIVAEHGRTRMELTAAGAGDAIVEEIAGLDGVDEAGLDAGVLVVQLPGDGDPMQMIETIGRIARSRGVEIVLRGIVEPSLETIFLDITGRCLRDESSDGWEA